MRTRKIEIRVADAILQNPISVDIGCKTYSVAPPSVATLILVSEAISRMPDTIMDDEKIVESSLAIAKECEPIAEVAAILLLGAKAIRKEERRPLNFFKSKKKSQLYILTQELLTNCSPQQLFKLISTLLGEMQVGDFFAITTFLQGVNLLRPTKVVTK